MAEGVEGLLRDETRRPGKKPLPPDTVARVVDPALGPPPGETTHWAGRMLAKAAGGQLAFSATPSESPPTRATPHAVVLSVDEKHNGTTMPFAALDGAVIGRNMQRHRHQEFIRFLNTVEAGASGQDIHATLDNHATHKHPNVRKWLARHPRWMVYFTLTSASWLNAVEGFFAKLTTRRLKRDVFHAVVDLQTAINRFIVATNSNPKSFIWTAAPDRVIAETWTCQPATRTFNVSPSMIRGRPERPAKVFRMRARRSASPGNRSSNANASGSMRPGSA